MSEDIALAATLRLEPEADVTDVELDQLTGSLRQQLLELEVHDVSRSRSESSGVGAKAGESLTVGLLSVVLAPTAVASLFRTIQVWIQRRPVRVVKITIGKDSIEVSGARIQEQHRMIDAFLRHLKD